jgi:hypothetical protein
MESIIANEQRLFSYLDFLKFEVDGIEYCMTHGTFRNKISAMIRKGEVGLVRYSPQGFYTIRGVIVEEPMAANHTGVTLSSTLRYLKNHPVYRLIQKLPFEQSALHDIRLRFTVHGIWANLSTSNTIDPVSKDIRLISQEINGLDIKVTIHRTDTVSVVIGCSYSPVAVNVAGIIRLSNSLTLIEERLRRDSGLEISSHMRWIVTMWHFGADASVEYKGEMFHASWKVGENAMVSLYSKEWKDGKCRIRAERQEYPNGPLFGALDQKLDQIRSR